MNLTEKRIDLHDDDIIFCLHTSVEHTSLDMSRKLNRPYMKWESLEINTVNSKKIKNLQKLKSQLLQDNEIVNRLIDEYDKWCRVESKILELYDIAKKFKKDEWYESVMKPLQDCRKKKEDIQKILGNKK